MGAVVERETGKPYLVAHCQELPRISDLDRGLKEAFNAQQDTMTRSYCYERGKVIVHEAKGKGRGFF